MVVYGLIWRSDRKEHGSRKAEPTASFSYHSKHVEERDCFDIVTVWVILAVEKRISGLVALDMQQSPIFHK